MNWLATVVASLALSFGPVANAAADSDERQIDGTTNVTDYGEYYPTVFDERFHLYDTNQDALLDEDEFAGEDFGRYDSNGDGAISLREFQRVEGVDPLFD